MQLKLYHPPVFLCSETELADYVDFLCNIKNIMGCLMKKTYFLAYNEYWNGSYTGKRQGSLQHWVLLMLLYFLRRFFFFFFYSLFYVDTDFLFINLQIVLWI